MGLKEENDQNQHHNVSIIGWQDLNCTECDAVVGYFPPEVKMRGDQIPVYCFLCATHLKQKAH